MTNAVSIAQLGSSNGTMRNRIINGAMTIDQRNSGASVTISSSGYTYCVDRFSIYATQGSKLTAQQNQGSITPPVGFNNYFGVTSSSAYSISSTDIFGIIQSIEGYNIADLNWGSANAKAITLSFWVRSSLTGTFGGSLINSGFTRSYPFTYTISSANTWEQKTITVAGETTGGWAVNNVHGIRVWFGLGVGTTNSAASGTWANGEYESATGSTSVVGTSGATFYITGVQLEAGSTATPFEYRSYGTELQLCQRYYELFGNGWPVRGETTNSSCVLFGNFKVEKRASPTISVLTSNVRMYEYGVADRDASTVTINSSAMITGGGAVKLSGWPTIGTGIIYVMGYNTSGPTGQPFSASAEL
jgi:hypothetical protein